MPENNSNISLSSAYCAETEKYENQDSVGYGELSPLTTALDSVRNSTHELNKGSRSGRMADYLNQAWHRLSTTDKGQFSVENGGHQEGTGLQEIFSEGESLRSLADSLHAPDTEEPVPHGWKGSLLKRCLVGAGYLTGTGLMSAAGYAGYRYYNDGSAYNESQKNTLKPSYTPSNTTQKDGSHGGNLEDSFGHHALHHDSPANKARHSRRHVTLDTPPKTLQINTPDDVKVEPVKICYEYFGMGRLGGRRKVPCANDLASNRRVNNKQSGQPAYPYIYTTKQPSKCKTQNQEQKCQNAHQNFHKRNPKKKLNNLVLNVGKTPCLCPPPVGDNARIIPPQTQKKKVPPPIIKVPTNKPQVNTPDKPTVSNTEKARHTSSTQKPTSPHQQSVLIQLPETRYLISPDVGRVPAPVDTASSVAPADESGDVKIENMYDFSCIDRRNNLSWADIIRQVGQTLRSPVQSLARESQVVHHHNTQKKGCPTTGESQHLQEVTGKVDAVLSQIMPLLPGANPFVVLQQIVSTALEIFADDLDGKPLDQQKPNDINQQVLFLSRQTIPTLTSKDMSGLYNKGSETVGMEKTTPLRKLFTLKGDDLYISLESKEYKILYSRPGNFIYIEKDGLVQKVYFDKNQNCWKIFEQKDIVHLSQLALMESYGTELIDSTWLKNAEISLDDSNPEIMVAKHNGILSKQVIINGLLVPVEEVTFDNELTTTVAVSDKVPGKKVLIQGEYGWQFEPESTNLDKNLKLILNSIEDKGVDYSDGNKFTFIKADAFSYDNLGSPHIKYKGRYYKVDSNIPSVYTLNEAPGNYFTLSDGILKIKSSTKLLDFEERVSAGISQLEDDGNLYLEGVAYDALIERGVLVTDTEPDSKVGPGVYVDKNHRFIFAANNKYFLLKSYTGNKIELENHIQGSKGIKLFRSYDTFLKVRDEEFSAIKYKELQGCRVVRSPTLSGAGCNLVWMEKDLDAVFKENISSQSYAKKSVINKSVVNSNDEWFPNLFHSIDSGKLYYLHDGHYFNAEWVPVNETVNPTGRPVLNIYASGNLFRKKRLIATIMSEKKHDRLELKTISGFVSEGTAVGKNIAQAYIDNREYKNVVNIKNIEGAIEQIKLAGQTVFPSINHAFMPIMDEMTLQAYIRGEFYPPRITTDDQYLLRIIRPHDFENVDEFSLRAGALKVRNHVLFIKNSMLPQVAREIKKGNENFAYYVGRVFNTDDSGFILGFLNELSERIKVLNKNIEMDNIYLCDLYRKSIDGVNSQGEPNLSLIKENLLPQERKQGTFAFALRDESKRIFISLDKLYFVDHTSPHYSQNPETDLTTTLLHEASHLNGMTTDYVYFPRENGHIYPVMDSIDSMAEKIQKGKLLDAKEFKKMSSEYINNISLLKNALSNPLQMDELSYLMQRDKGYLTSLLFNTADGIALLIRDLYKIAQTGKIIEEES